MEAFGSFTGLIKICLQIVRPLYGARRVLKGLYIFQRFDQAMCRLRHGFVGWFYPANPKTFAITISLEVMRVFGAYSTITIVRNHQKNSNYLGPNSNSCSFL